MRAIINGGRDYKEHPGDLEWLSALRETFDITIVVSGGASGADALGEKFAKMNSMPIIRYSANWEKYGKAAGPIRNQAMVDGADLLISFPGGRGTEDCIRRARAAGIPVKRRWTPPPAEVQDEIRRGIREKLSGANFDGDY